MELNQIGISIGNYMFLSVANWQHGCMVFMGGGGGGGGELPSNNYYNFITFKLELN